MPDRAKNKSSGMLAIGSSVPDKEFPTADSNLTNNKPHRSA